MVLSAQVMADAAKVSAATAVALATSVLPPTAPPVYALSVNPVSSPSSAYLAVTMRQPQTPTSPYVPATEPALMGCPAMVSAPVPWAAVARSANTAAQSPTAQRAVAMAPALAAGVCVTRTGVSTTWQLAQRVPLTDTAQTAPVSVLTVPAATAATALLATALASVLAVTGAPIVRVSVLAA